MLVLLSRVYPHSRGLLAVEVLFRDPSPWAVVAAESGFVVGGLRPWISCQGQQACCSSAIPLIHRPSPGCPAPVSVSLRPLSAQASGGSEHGQRLDQPPAPH